MAVFKLSSTSDTLNGGAGNDIYLISAAANYASISQIVDAGGISDEFRFSSIISNDTLLLLADGASIERIVIGTGTAIKAVSSGKTALNVNAAAYAGNGLVIIGNNGANQIQGTGLADSLVGAVGNDSLIGGIGNDTLDGGAGNDTLDGGGGDDVYVIDAADTLIDSGGIDTIKTSINGYVLGDDFENLFLLGAAKVGNGNAGDNRLLGNAQANTLNGGVGKDTLDGGIGADKLVGGADNDTYFVDNAADKITELADDGIDTINSSINFSLASANAANVENLTLIGLKAINATGNSGANQIVGNTATNVINGDGGVDTLDGGAGNDIYLITKAQHHSAAEFSDSSGLQDEIRFASTTAGETLTLYAGDLGIERVVVGTGIAKTAVVSKTNLNVDASAVLNGLVIIGNAGANQLIGTALSDTISGGAGNDILDGGLGDDSLIGGLGNDTYVLDSALDIVVEAKSAGFDTVQVTGFNYDLGNNVEALVLNGSDNISGIGNSLANLMAGNIGNNSLDGGLGNDTLIGDAGDDTLTGGAGLDVLQGGEGNDSLDGGEGNQDTAMFSGSSLITEVTENEDGSYTFVGLDGTDTLRGIEFIKFDSEAKSVSISTLTGLGITKEDGIAAVHDQIDDPKWGAGATVDTTLSYGFFSAIPNYDTQHLGFSAINAAGIAAIEQVLGLYENISLLTFNRIDNTNATDLTFGSEQQAGTLAGYAYLPSGDGFGETNISGDVWLNKTFMAKPGAVDPGGFMFSTMIHEIGHALGLKHVAAEGATDEGPFLPPKLDSNLYSIMSYNNLPHSTIYRIDGNSIGGEQNSLSMEAKTPMLFDIAAIQSIYGANLAYNSGNNTYVYKSNEAFFECIWDGAGDDTIDASDYSRNSIIDLREGHFSSLGYGKLLVARGSTDFNLEEVSESELASFGSQFMNFYKATTYNGENNLSIAYGAQIENAIGGAGDDVLRGNELANLLQAGAGDDTLSGGAGDDILMGSDGSDDLLGGAGADIFVFDTDISSSLDTVLDFNSGVDKLKLDTNIFTGLIGFEAENLAFGAAQDDNDLLIFDSVTGGLFYDADGTDTGSTAIQFAILNNVTSIAFTDFLVV